MGFRRFFMDGLKIEKLDDNLYCFEETGSDAVDAYFVVGSDRAVMIDTLMTLTGLYAEARALSPLPIDVVIAHGHPDHCGRGTEEFKVAGCTIYLDSRDEKVISDMGFAVYPRGFFTDLRTRRCFDLGDTVLELISLPGHTPGSAMLLDRERQRLYSSDSLGSGSIWMQLDHSRPLHEYADNLRDLYAMLKPLTNLRIHPGHRYQSPQPLGLDYLVDLLEAVDLVLAGKATGIPAVVDRETLHMEFLELKHKRMLGLAYDPQNL
jgi:glyoxylase-like metal-dependent hydrolase (beta-lactamase superfamily II)